MSVIRNGFCAISIEFAATMFTDPNLKNLDHTQLIDLLADQTAKYTQALVKGDSGNTLDYYRTLISGISKEIERRQNAKNADSADQKIA